MPSLSEPERRSVMQLARTAVVDAVSRHGLPAHIPNDGIFAERRGVFVTLRLRGRLQGCIGVVESDESLGEAIVRCATSAALQDPRFAPMRADQLSELTIEISLLSRPTPITAEAIEIGRHGLLLVHQGRRGVLLPQVAVERHLTREQFLGEICHKAGLSRDSWRDADARVFGFTCEVFADQRAANG